MPKVTELQDHAMKTLHKANMIVSMTLIFRLQDHEIHFEGYPPLANVSQAELTARQVSEHYLKQNLEN